MEWERASPGAGAARSNSSSSSNSEAVVAHDKKNKCNKPARANDLSNNNNPTTTSGQHQLVSRKNKPIPPPLDLSIGAANLSLHHQHHQHHHPHNQNQSSTHHSSNLHPHSGNTTSHSRSPHQLQPQQQSWYLPHQQQQQQSPSGYLGSPKFNQSEKSLPLRKRWHSWSPVPGMNGQEDSGLMPSYTDLPPSPLAIKSEPQQPPSSVSSQQESVQESVTTSVANPNVGAESQNPLSAHSLTSYGFSTATSSGLTTSSYRHHYGSLMNGCNSSSNNNNNHHQHHHQHNNSNNNGLDLGSSIQTPSPFYTPNEPSPKVMNSNVFTYSTPDTSFYQGPFSPMRTPCVYYPPNSPFTHLSLNTPGGPNSGSSIGNGQGLGSGSQMMNLNMIPSTLLSPAPSQASTNSLSYEDLNLSEKSSSALLNFVPPIWSIFISGTKVRFQQSRHFSSTDWLSVDFLAQNEALLGLKEDYAPQGLVVRKLVVTSSSKERIQVTFCPVGDLTEHPMIEVDCEPGHPFMVEKKGWCAVKPDVFQELFGSHCLQLEGGDVCLNMSRLGQQQQQNVPGQLNVVHPLVNVTSGQTPLPSISSGSYALNLNGNLSSSCSPNSSSNSVLNNLNNLSPNMNIQTSSSPSCNVKFEPGLASVEEKVVPISILPASQTTSIQSVASQLQHLSQQQQSVVAASLICSPGHGKMFAVPSSMPSAASTALPAPSAPAPSPAKRAKENQHNGAAEQKGRRPMNAFLLFAKDKRPELIQQYPGKDNRSISVLLGEAWANLEPPEKERYSSNARARAEEQKRIHPDCWKRKRSQSTSS